MEVDEADSRVDDEDRRLALGTQTARVASHTNPNFILRSPTLSSSSSSLRHYLAFLMITFRPLAGSARSETIQPLAYLLQVDDVRILLDCGAPDWCPEPSSSAVTNDSLNARDYHWQQYCDTLRQFVFLVYFHKYAHNILIKACAIY
jgi:hypothetical protein